MVKRKISITPTTDSHITKTVPKSTETKIIFPLRGYICQKYKNKYFRDNSAEGRIYLKDIQKILKTVNKIQNRLIPINLAILIVFIIILGYVVLFVLIIYFEETKRQGGLVFMLFIPLFIIPFIYLCLWARRETLVTKAGVKIKKVFLEENLKRSGVGVRFEYKTFWLCLELYEFEVEVVEVLDVRGTDFGGIGGNGLEVDGIKMELFDQK